jgi:hypothetical protein
MYEFIMCFKCANLHAHFTGLAVAYAAQASILWALIYDQSLYTIPSKFSANTTNALAESFIQD